MANRLLRLQKEHEEIRERQGALLTTLDERAEQGGDPDFTEEEKAEYDSLDAERELLATRITREQEFRASELKIDSVTSTVVGEDQITVVTSNEEPEAEPPKPFKNFAEQLKAIRDVATGVGTEEQRNRLMDIQGAAQGAGTANPAEGGFLVQTDFASEIIRVMWEQGSLLSRVNRQTITRNSDSLSVPALKEASRATGSRYGGVQAYWIDQGTAPTATNPSLRMIHLKLNKVGALGYATEELMEDAPLFSSLMTEAFADELTFTIENAIFQGTGAGQPLGILAHASAVDVTAESGQSASTIEYENIQNMWARMYARGRSRAVWLINQDAEPELFNMSLAIGTGGVPVYLPPGGLSVSPYGTLMGRPVIPIEYAATLGTSGDITFVDLSQYLFIDKGGVRSNESIHVRFTTDERAFRAMYRCDGQPTWESAVTPFTGSNTQSAIITLATRS